ncbi:MAG: amidohydrolase [Dehalococcoidia bacterium]|nr:amidohydrolase [Dehalococcoidia bacterium]
MTTTAKPTHSQQIRAKLSHPIIDGDGHMIEVSPVLFDYLRQVGGSRLTQRFLDSTASKRYRQEMLTLTQAQRVDADLPVTSWWFHPAKNTLDRATAVIPRLLYERLDEIGIDFSIVYGSEGAFLMQNPDDEIRQEGCRAFNLMVRDLYGPYAGRLTPAAMIPMANPKEAIAELEYVVNVLKLKVVQMPNEWLRPVPRVQREDPQMTGDLAWADKFGLDSAHDYDPVWAKCVELKVAPTFHGAHIGKNSRRSTSSYMYNHIGAFASSAEATCKSLWLGGVTRRFPTLNFGFLEGGAAWACSLYADTIAHWKKRNGRAIRDLDPEIVDRPLMERLLHEKGEDVHRRLEGEVRKWVHQPQPRPEHPDEFRHMAATRAEELRDLFVPRFYIGCEADDATNAWAFDTKVNPFGARLRAIFSSDIGHWDVTDMREVLEEAYELLERGVLTAQDFKDFSYTNIVQLHAGMNPSFFNGTRVEAAAKAALATGVR